MTVLHCTPVGFYKKLNWDIDYWCVLSADTTWQVYISDLQRL